jgi:hypothetical protein
MHTLQAVSKSMGRIHESKMFPNKNKSFATHNVMLKNNSRVEKEGTKVNIFLLS